MDKDLLRPAIYAFAGGQLATYGQCVMDKHSFIKSCNQAFAQQFGYNWDDLCGEHMAKILSPDHPHPHGSPEDLTDMSLHIDKGQTISYRAAGVVFGTKKNGKQVSVFIYDLKAGYTRSGEFLMTGRSRLAKPAEVKKRLAEIQA